MTPATETARRSTSALGAHRRARIAEDLKTLSDAELRACIERAATRPERGEYYRLAVREGLRRAASPPNE